MKTPELAARGRHNGQAFDALRAKTYLNEPGPFEDFVKASLKDKDLKRRPELEEFRAGSQYKVSELVNFEKLDETEDVKILLDAMKKEKDKEKTVGSDDADEFDKIKTQSLKVYKAIKLGESIFERQSETLTPEEELGSESPVSYEEDFEDLSRNADLYVFNDQMTQGYRGVDVNTRDNEESLGEVHMKDYYIYYIDVANQENAARPSLLSVA